MRRRNPRPCSLFLTQLLENARHRTSTRVASVSQERFLRYLDKVLYELFSVCDSSSVDSKSKFCWTYISIHLLVVASATCLDFKMFSCFM